MLVTKICTFLSVYRFTSLQNFIIHKSLVIIAHSQFFEFQKQINSTNVLIKIKK